MKTNQNGIDLVKRFEGLKLESYYCPANILTIGYGHTGPDVYRGQKISEVEAEELLKADLSEAEGCISSYVLVKLNQNQFSAISSFIFNLGCHNFIKSTLLKKINGGLFDEIPFELNRWNKARNPSTGKLEVLRGLTRRRAAEADLFMRPVNQYSPTIKQENNVDVVQETLEPSPIRKERDSIIESRTMKTGVVAGSAGVLGFLSDKFESIIAWLPSYTPDVLVVVTVIGVLMMLYFRFTDHREAMK